MATKSIFMPQRHAPAVHLAFFVLHTSNTSTCEPHKIPALLWAIIFLSYFLCRLNRRKKREKGLFVTSLSLLWGLLPPYLQWVVYESSLEHDHVRSAPGLVKGLPLFPWDDFLWLSYSFGTSDKQNVLVICNSIQTNVPLGFNYERSIVLNEFTCH